MFRLVLLMRMIVIIEYYDHSAFFGALHNYIN